MTCDELREHYELYATGLLEDAAVRQELEEHLGRRCANCVRGAREAGESFGLVAMAAPLMTPPADLRERVMASVRRSAPKNNVVAMTPAPAAAGRPAWQTALPWAAAAALLLGVGYYRQAEQTAREQLLAARIEIRQLGDERHSNTTELQRLRPLVEFLQQPDTKVVTFGERETAPPKGRVLVNPGRGVLLMANNLPALEAGRTFQMWILPKTGGPRPAGLFGAQGGVAVHLQTGPVDLAEATAVAVSVEPESGSTAPTTTPILVASLGAL